MQCSIFLGVFLLKIFKNLTKFNHVKLLRFSIFTYLWVTLSMKCEMNVLLSSPLICRQRAHRELTNIWDKKTSLFSYEIETMPPFVTPQPDHEIQKFYFNTGWRKFYFDFWISHAFFPVTDTLFNDIIQWLPFFSTNTNEGKLLRLSIDSTL